MCIAMKYTSLKVFNLKHNRKAAYEPVTVSTHTPCSVSILNYYLEPIIKTLGIFHFSTHQRYSYQQMSRSVGKHSPPYAPSQLVPTLDCIALTNDYKHSPHSRSTLIFNEDLCLHFPTLPMTNDFKPLSMDEQTTSGSSKVSRISSHSAHQL